MKYDDFLNLVRDKPVIRPKDFLEEDHTLLVQISRWVKDGKLIQLKRGAYILKELYQKNSPNQLYLANNLVWPSYISLEKALEYWGLIPEAVRIYTSITTKRPQEINTEIGTFSYKSILPSLFWGYQSLDQGNLVSFIAKPEKAILDFFYFHRGQITSDYLLSLRLQNTEMLNPEILRTMSNKFKKPKIKNACLKLLDFIASQEKEFKTL